MNLSANLLGMGNAATPFGIAAMKELAKRSPYSETATDEMITFVVMNTASIQLIPTTVAMLRSAAGSTAPFELMPAIWITSFVSLFVGILTTDVYKSQALHRIRSQHTVTLPKLSRRFPPFLAKE